METYTYRSLTPADLPQVAGLQQAYADLYPGAPVVPGELYLSPAFREGQDVFCAFSQVGGKDRLVGYAPVYVQLPGSGPANLPILIWTEVKAQPDLPDADSGQVKEQLLKQVELRAREILQPYPNRVARMIFDYRPNETPAIRFIQAHGFTYLESVFYMRRSLNEPLPAALSPEGVTIRPWKMESEAEQRAYISARNECFSEAPITLSEWQYYMKSPQWAAGTMIAAISGNELVGAVNVYWNEAENQQTRRKVGFTEDIFVRRPWQGRGIARAAIAEALRYLKENGLEEAHLSVRELNENALGIYKDLGYQLVQESCFYAKSI